MGSLWRRGEGFENLEPSLMEPSLNGARRRRRRRGDVKVRIYQEVVKEPVKDVIKRVKKPVKNVIERVTKNSTLRRERGIANEPHESVLVTQASEGGTVVLPLERLLALPVAQAPERGTVNVPDEPTPEPVLVSEAQSPEAPPNTSSQAVDIFLQDSPFPTKNVAMVRQWPKVDMSKTIEHEGSLLFQDEEGNWIVTNKPCHEYSDTALVPLMEPNVRVPTPL